MVPAQLRTFIQSGVLDRMVSYDSGTSHILNDHFDTLYVITTKQSIKRQEAIQKQLNSMGISYILCIMNEPSQDLYSIYTKWYTASIEPQRIAVERKPTNFSKLSLGEFGCCASHAHLLSVIAGKTNNDKKYLILEDDAVFINNFEMRFEQLMQNINNCDFFALGCNDYNISNRNIITDTDKKTLLGKQYLYCPNPEQGILYGMHSYALNPQAAAQFFEYVNTFVRPCDHYMWLMFYKTKGLTVWPPLIIQDRTTSKLRDLSQEQNTEQYYYAKCLPHLDKTLYQYIQKKPDCPISVVIAYFNPAKYYTRKANLEYMLKALLKHSINEIIIVSPENTIPALQTFAANDPRIKQIHVKTESVLFYKESLQNIGWKASNKANPYVLFLDADILFETDWTETLMQSLESNDLVQGWHKASITDRYNNSTQVESWASSLKSKEQTNKTNNTNTGFAWAFRRDFLESIKDLNDFCVVGSGDQILAHTLVNADIQPHHHYMKQSYEQFKDRIQQNLKSGFGFLENVRIKHLYHGRLTNRKYYERHGIISDLKFTEDDLVLKDGLVHFKNPETWNPHFYKYFSERNEDEGFSIYCKVRRGPNVFCASSVKKSDVLVIIENNPCPNYVDLIKIAQIHGDATLFIYEENTSDFLSNIICKIDNLTKEKIKNHVFYTYIL